MKQKKEWLGTTQNTYGGSTAVCTVYNGAYESSSRYRVATASRELAWHRNKTFTSLTRSLIATGFALVSNHNKFPFINSKPTSASVHAIFIVLSCTPFTSLQFTITFWTCQQIAQKSFASFRVVSLEVAFIGFPLIDYHSRNPLIWMIRVKITMTFVKHGPNRKNHCVFM